MTKILIFSWMFVYQRQRNIGDQKEFQLALLGALFMITMVISGGENIYCAEVERVMSEMPEVTECAAFGIADDRLGELLVSVVVADNIDEQTVIQTVGEKLAKYKAPGKVIFSDQPLPRNAVGKVDKVKLRADWPAMAGETA